MARQIADATQIQEALERLAGEISASLPLDSLILVGIQRRGVYIAQRLAEIIEKKSGKTVKQGILDITFYRDDLSMVSARPVVHSTSLPDDISGQAVVLVDDVLFTGRTIRAALDALADNGRAKTVRLAVLIDRGWRELPIQADFTGFKVETRFEGKVEVSMQELDKKDLVEVVE